MHGKSLLFAMMVGCALFLPGVIVTFVAPGKANAEFYSYEDRNGTIHFVDDLSKIPTEYRKKKQVRKDKYDDLSADERALLLEKERDKRASDRRRESDQQEQARQRRAEEEMRAAREQAEQGSDDTGSHCRAAGVRAGQAEKRLSGNRCDAPPRYRGHVVCHYPRGGRTAEYPGGRECPRLAWSAAG